MDQIHVPLVAAIPNGLIVEWMYGRQARIAELLRDPIVPQEGVMTCKTRPGVGLEFSDESFKKHGTQPKKKSVDKMNPRYQWPPYA
jgi:hypothetical protein